MSDRQVMKGTTVIKAVSKPKKLELEVLRQQLGRRGKRLTQETVDTINKLQEDTEYGEQFVEAYKDYFNVLEKNSKWTQGMYLNAMKFFILTETGHTLLDAYIKTFPERLERRIAKGESRADLGGEASRFNSSPLVNEIRSVSSVGIQLTHRFMLMDALSETHNMMFTARSETVRQKAAETLIRELKPSEEAKISIDVNTNDRSAIDELRRATEEFTSMQLSNIKAGAAVKEMAEMTIIRKEQDE